jgi:hypothetical protein
MFFFEVEFAPFSNGAVLLFLFSVSYILFCGNFHAITVAGFFCMLNYQLALQQQCTDSGILHAAVHFLSM